ncbi:outer membrane beta-barrel protein [uncultured Helicobacter sp.]|uniref:outer membrane beta-barrel protein n=1 Tax=uncultured Helicobacter sp. TaxID=175537 RepID=UPI00374FB23F
MKKLIVSGALALAFSTSAVVAEESGAFVGVDLGMSNAVMTQDAGGGPAAGSLNNKAASVGNFRYGLLGGYKWFFTESFGLRAYLQVNNGANQIPEGVDTHAIINTLNVMANVDALYNLYSTQESSIGLFAGLSFGYAIHSGKAVDDLKKTGLKDPSGFDMGINFGLRTIIAKHHGIEFFNRFGIIGASATSTLGAGTPLATDVKMTTLQPYAFGVRYTYNF